MDSRGKKELMYLGLVTLIGLILIFVLSATLPTKPNPLNDVNLDANKPIAELAKDKCIALCTANKDSLKDLNSGPCLSDIFKYDVNDYVCDIVNDPRLDVDNMPENQCKEFLNGDKNSFVEVSTKCEFVK
ncbi:MAG: hypothetical protein COT55_02485 [Candidatus Diapherotrites archaeon CG09_land_8_20_14_0_10_32_12]|nr:MAG: hypothetical protein COT55_02485 [Candidatus Diapherotrites archaeon CG09_land_8_20_14_0_10_32_12]